MVVQYSRASCGKYPQSPKLAFPDVLVVEPAFSTSLFPKFYSSHCLHCFERLGETPVHCPGCPTVSSSWYYYSTCITVGRVAHPYHTVSRSDATLKSTTFLMLRLYRSQNTSVLSSWHKLLARKFNHILWHNLKLAFICRNFLISEMQLH